MQCSICGSGCYNRAMPVAMPGFRFASSAARAATVGLMMIACLAGFDLAHAQKISAPKVPDAIQSRPGEDVVLVAHASGSQIYACRSGADGKFSWTLKAPEADLKDQNDKVIGRHFAGPAWKLTDGSEVTGKAVAHVDSDDPNSIPWLLVAVAGHTGNGLLATVTTIQRVHTHGGKPPAEGCDASHGDAETKSSYTADYYFYAPVSGAPAKESGKQP